MSAIIRQVFNLYKISGGVNYIGEGITQLQHAIQAALLAEREGFTKPVILAAFLHDVGHLVHYGRVKEVKDNKNGSLFSRIRLRPNENEELVSEDNYDIPPSNLMGNYGIMNHEEIGCNFLRSYRFPFVTCDMVKQHVNTKRFNVTINPDYYDKLSDASKETLTYQSGLMTKEEMIDFIRDPLYEYHLKLREWDNGAKSTDPSLLKEIDNMDAIEKYYKMACEVVPR